MDKIEIFFYIALPALMLGAAGLAVRYLIKLSGLYLQAQDIELV